MKPPSGTEHRRWRFGLGGNYAEECFSASCAATRGKHDKARAGVLHWAVPVRGDPTSMAQRKLDVVLDSVKRLLRVGATANLVNLLQKQHPADLAQVFTELGDKNRQSAFSLLVERNSRLAMEGLSELGPEGGAALLAGRSAEEIGKLLQELPSDDAAAIIDYLPEDVSVSVLELMQKRPAGGDVGELLEYPEQTAGRIMNPRVFALAEDMTAAEAITALQGSRDVEMVFYLYVIDARRHLVGVVSLRRLLLVPPSTPLKRIMTTDLISVRVDTDQEEVARLVASYNLLAIPVVDEENKLAGVITVDDVIDVIKDEATEDVYRLAGVTGDDRVFTRPSESLRKRLPWLQVNLVTAFIAASVVALFEGTISRWSALAVFMPVVAGMGGNAATQTLTVIVRGIALGELTWANTRKALLKEAAVGIANGIGCGLVAGIVVWIWKGSPALGACIGAAMVINMFVAATAGTLIPLALRALKVDPALASSVFITTLTDVFGFLSFLGLGTLVLRRWG
jgi:magnesium transporter